MNVAVNSWQQMPDAGWQNVYDKDPWPGLLFPLHSRGHLNHPVSFLDPHAHR